MSATAKPQAGMAMIEALVASLVLGIGMMGAVQLTLQGLHTAADTHQRITAHGLALDAMECHQSARTGCPLNDQITAQTVFTRTVTLTPRAGLALTDITVTVQWTSAARSGTASNATQLVLHSSRASVALWLGVSLP